MSSYTSSFKAILLALLAIAAIETAFAAVHAATPAERSDYLNRNFNSSDPFHKRLISEKLKNAIAHRPDVIQIGDSSGFHGIVPSVVEQYLGGLRYENLSCCANTGFGGYYAIAQYMFRHVSGIRAVVLYIGLNNIPRRLDDAETKIVGGEDRLQTAFGWGATATTWPSLAARLDVVRWVHSRAHRYFQWEMQPHEDMYPELMESLRTSKGWRVEADIHSTPERHARYLQGLCGPTGAPTMSADTPDRMTRDLLGTLRSHTEVELRRLADLAARNGAKLILITQPYPCRAIEGNYLALFRASVEKVQAAYPNVIVPYPPLFEHWPGEMFTTADHARAGHEYKLSRRAGRLVAAALGLPYREPPDARPTPATRVVLSLSGADLEQWKREGVTLSPASNPQDGILTESGGSGMHVLEKAMPDLGAKTYTATLVFTNAGRRTVFFRASPLKWPGDDGYVFCNAAAGEATRSMGVLDTDIQKLEDGAFQCSATFRSLKPGVLLSIGLADKLGMAPYVGDEKSGIVLHRFELREIVDSP